MYTVLHTDGVSKKFLPCGMCVSDRKVRLYFAGKVRLPWVGFSAESVSTRLFCPVNQGASLDNTRSSIRVCLAKDSVRICLRLGPRRVVAELTELLRPNVFDPQFWFWFFRPIKFRNYPTRRLHSGSFLGLPYRILNIHHNKELLWSLWVKPINTAYSPRVGQTMAPKKVGNLIKGQLTQGLPIH